MRVDSFDFDLPAELIAHEPVSPRDSSRLLEISGENNFSDRNFVDILSLLQPKDLLVFNNTKVIPARISGSRRGAKVEITLHKNLGTGKWRAFAKPARKLNAGDIFFVAEDFQAEILQKLENGEIELQFAVAGVELDNKLLKYGSMPLPPYIKRKNSAANSDNQTYQTVYAKEAGAVAAPTAGLHFTQVLLDKISHMGVEMCFVTLHVGAGTFLPVKCDDTSDHIMHSENFVISESAAASINKTRANGGRIIAVGTTSLRALESSADISGIVKPGNSDTNLFIVPGYKFKVVDLLLTNFHLPRSTLFMLVSAFSGLRTMQNAYKHAISKKYRFFSYGDACLLHKEKI